MGGPPDLNNPQVNRAIEKLEDDLKRRMFRLLNRDEEFKKIMGVVWDLSFPIHNIHDERIVPGLKKTVRESLPPPSAGQVMNDAVHEALEQAAQAQLRTVPENELMDRLEKSTDPAEKERLKHFILLRALGDH